MTSYFELGCFEVVLLEPGKWKLTNKRSNFSHISYGTEEEMVEQAKIQTAAWERRVAGLSTRKNFDIRRSRS